MPDSINTLTLTGRAVAAPTSPKEGIAKFAVAVNRSFRREGEEGWTEQVSFFDVVSYNGLSSTLMKKLRTGDFVTISGRLHQERWQDRETQANRSRVVIVANAVQGEFMFRSKEPNDQPDVPPADFNSSIDEALEAQLELAAGEPAVPAAAKPPVEEKPKAAARRRRVNVT